MEPLGQCVAFGPHQHWQQLCVIATAPLPHVTLPSEPAQGPRTALLPQRYTQKCSCWKVGWEEMGLRAPGLGCRGSMLSTVCAVKWGSAEQEITGRKAQAEGKEGRRLSHVHTRRGKGVAALCWAALHCLHRGAAAKTGIEQREAGTQAATSDTLPPSTPNESRSSQCA